MNQEPNTQPMGNNTTPNMGMGTTNPQTIPVPQPMPVQPSQAPRQPMPQPVPTQSSSIPSQPVGQPTNQPVQPIIQSTQNPVTQSMHEQVYTKPIEVPRPGQPMPQFVTNQPSNPTQPMYVQPTPQASSAPASQPMTYTQPIPAVPTQPMPTPNPQTNQPMPQTQQMYANQPIQNVIEQPLNKELEEKPKNTKKGNKLLIPVTIAMVILVAVVVYFTFFY